MSKKKKCGRPRQFSKKEFKKKREAEAYRGSMSTLSNWLSDLIQQAKGALKTGPPEWFKNWSKVFIVKMWSP